MVPVGPQQEAVRGVEWRIGALIQSHHQAAEHTWLGDQILGKQSRPNTFVNRPGLVRRKANTRRQIPRISRTGRDHG